MNMEYKPHLLLANLFFTQLSLLGTLRLSPSAVKNKTALLDKSRIELCCAYISAQVVAALCEQLESLERRSGGSTSRELLSFSRQLLFEVQTFVILNVLPGGSTFIFPRPAWILRRRVRKLQQRVSVVKEILEVAIRSKFNGRANGDYTPTFFDNPEAGDHMPGIFAGGGRHPHVYFQAEYLHVLHVHRTQIINVGSGSVSGNNLTG